MSLGVFIIRRLLLLIPVLIGITLVTFVVSHAVPADPIAANLGQRAQDDPAIIAQYRHEWGLDQAAAAAVCHLCLEYPARRYGHLNFHADARCRWTFSNIFPPR